MTIAKLEKLTLYGAKSRKVETVNRLQELGCVHLVSLATADSPPMDDTDIALDSRNALKYLQTCAEQRHQVRQEPFDPKRIVAEALEIQSRERDLSDERERLRKAIRDLEPWGEFRLPDNHGVGGHHFWFYILPLSQLEKLQKIKHPWQIAAQDHRFAYVVMLSDEEPVDVPGTNVTLDPSGRSALQARLETVVEAIDELHHRRVGLTRWCERLRGDLDRADDEASLHHAMQLALEQGNVFALQGWYPTESRAAIRKFASDNGLAASIAPPGPDDAPPTLLENPERIAGGEGLVTFYKVPGYLMWDPSGVVLVSFALFFAMILADAGYAALLGLLLAWFWKRLGTSQGGRRGRAVMSAIVAASLVYGIIAGSYFGVSPPAGSFLGRIRLLDAQNLATMMPLSICVGVLHIGLANLVTAWRLRGKAQALSALGWMLVMAGAMAVAKGMTTENPEETAKLFQQVGSILFCVGLGAVFLFSSERPLLSWSIKNHFMRLVDGVMGLTRFTTLFGDVLSYLRLFALGLSSAQLAGTFNNLAAEAWDQAGFGVLLAIGIVLLGHFLNVLLSIMSGVVHGLRLNCIEFFNWSLPEEGQPFRAFAKKARST